MAERPAARTPDPDDLPLGSVRVVDATDEYGAYAGRLLADLGAEVIRVEPPSGDPLRRREPLVETPRGEVSAFAWFVNLNKRSIVLDLDESGDRVTFLRLLDDADVLLECWRADDANPLDLGRAELAERCPDLVRVSITPFGDGGPQTGRAASDLTTLAAGGLLSLGGYPDAEPVAAYGGQSLFAASVFGAVAALMGILGRNRDGRGRHLDVSAQEAVAAALEDAIPTYELTGHVRRRAGDRPREAGSGIYPCADGYVSMIAGRLGTARAWLALTQWLVEEGVPGADELLTPEWEAFPFRQRPESIARFRDVFETFTMRHSREELYLEAQRRSIALAPINEVGDLFADRQLTRRGFFREVVPSELDRPVAVPGRPYRLDGSPGPAPRPAPQAGRDGSDITTALSSSLDDAADVPRASVSRAILDPS